MTLLSNHKKLEDKQKAEQKETAEKLVKITDKVFDLLKAEDITIFETKTIHSLLGQRMTQQLTAYIDNKKLNEVA